MKKLIFPLSILWILLNHLQAQNMNYFAPDNARNNQGNWNTFVGRGAGVDNTSGGENTFIGANSGRNNTTGTFNTFVGGETGIEVTTARSNTFIGQSAGRNTTEGYRNVFLGSSAGTRNTTGYKNTFIGTLAGEHNTTANLGTFVGYRAGRANTTGENNVFVGNASGYDNTTGEENAFLGSSSGENNTTGSRNVFLGHRAGNDNLTGNDNVFIGYHAGLNERGSAQLYIANAEDNTLIRGDFSRGLLAIGTNTPLIHTLTVNGNTNYGSLLLSAGTRGSGGNSELILGEDHDGTYGMSIKYDGDDNLLQIYGKSNLSEFGPHMSIERNSGNIGIGTTHTGSFKLAVEGTIGAREIQVTSVNPWPDYVFEDNYELRNLNELEVFIKANKHLPNVPSAKEVEQNGHQLGSMDAKLLEKIEELTLYAIEQQKLIEKQNKLVQELSGRIRQLEDKN